MIHKEKIKRKKPINKEKIKRKKRSDFTRKKIFKDRLKEAIDNSGYDLNYILKSGKYKNCAIKFVIDNDILYMENILKNTSFCLNKRTFNYYFTKLKDHKNKEEERGRRWGESFFNDEWKEWESFFRGNHTYNNYYSNSSNYRYDNRDKYNNSKYKPSNYISEVKKHGAVLGLNGKVKKSEIKTYYKQAALKYHPDKNNNSPESLEMMKKVNNAYDYFKRFYQLD